MTENIDKYFVIAVLENNKAFNPDSNKRLYISYDCDEEFTHNCHDAMPFYSLEEILDYHFDVLRDEYPTAEDFNNNFEILEIQVSVLINKSDIVLSEKNVYVEAI